MTQPETRPSETARLGILMLDSRFPRIVGDVGNPASWRFPVRYRTVPGATPEAVVRGDAETFVQQFIAAGRDLVAEGCTGIATTCGFLAPLRLRLARELGVPVAASALEQARQIEAMLPAGRQVGILTISADSLSAVHLNAAEVPEGAPVQGIEGSRFADTILGNRTELDVARAEQEMVRAARRLVEAHPQIGAILLECTNMPPYAATVARATGLPVFSILTYLDWFHAGLRPGTRAPEDQSNA